MKQINENKKEAITGYFMVSLSKKAVKVSQFCEITGLQPSYFSQMKSGVYREKVPAPVWEYLDKIYEAQAFDTVMQGGWGKYVSKKGKSDKDPVGLPIEPDGQINEVIPASKPYLQGSETVMKSKKLGISSKGKPKPKPDSKESKGIPGILLQQEITVGTAIDVLIKAGAKLNVSIEL